jgi:site-specific DNA recombinase
MESLLLKRNTISSPTQTQAQVVALYARVSTSRQEQEATIESQIEEVRAKIIEVGDVISPDHIYVDNGWTGELLQRPALDALRDAAAEGQFKKIYVYDRGRLSRKFVHQELVIEELSDIGVEFVSLHDVNAVTPEESFMQSMMGIFHEYERLKIAERFRRGKLFNAKSGKLINGQAKYGWRYVKKTDACPTHYEINEEEARVVRMIWDWFGNERVAIREIIRRLYKMGIPPKLGKSPFWTKGPVVRLLECESYVSGIVYYNKSEAIVAKNSKSTNKYKRLKRTSRKVRPKEEWIPFKVQPIIDDYSLYEKNKKYLTLNQKYARKNRKFDYLLTQVIYCGCGCRRVGDGSSKEGHFYYRCTERIARFPVKQKCKMKGINATVLDTIVWDELVKVMTEPELLKKCATDWMRLQVQNDLDEEDKNRLNNLVQNVVDEEKRYAKAYGSGTLEFEQFQELIKESKKKKALYKKQLAEIESKSSPEALDISTDELIEEAKEVLKTFDFSNKVQVVRDIIEKVIIKNEKEVEIWAHLPLNLRKLGYEPQDRNRRIAECRQINIV